MEALDKVARECLDTLALLTDKTSASNKNIDDKETTNDKEEIIKLYHRLEVSKWVWGHINDQTIVPYIKMF